MTDVARALSCPLGPRTSPGSQGPADAIFIQHFGDLFPIPNRPAGCSDRQTCLGDEACYAPLLSRQLLGFASEQEAVEHALDNPKASKGGGSSSFTVAGSTLLCSLFSPSPIHGFHCFHVLAITWQVEPPGIATPQSPARGMRVLLMFSQ